MSATPSPPIDLEPATATISTATNATIKFVPTPEGMFCAYLSLLIMALIPIFYGSFKSVKYHIKTVEKCRETGEAAETMTVKDALIFPLIASCALFGFYIFIKLSPELVNLVVSGYFFVLGVFAIFRMLRSPVYKILPKKFNSTHYILFFVSKNVADKSKNEESTKATETNDSDDRQGSVSPTDSNSSLETDFAASDVIVDSKFMHSDILALVLSALFGTWYLYSKHWIANNTFGLAFALNGIELLAINSFKIGYILLAGLFVYDVFWVFGTNVMVSVAKNFDAPIKILFPQDFLIRGFWGQHFAMLGLGDIVIPGILIAFLLRFDHSLHRKKYTYFWSCFSAYVFGLSLTIAVMTYFKHAQPALLYLVPCCVFVPVIVAAMKGDLKTLHNYRDHPIVEDDAEDEKEATKTIASDKKPTRSISTRASSKKEQ